jgi:thiol-disulfide isomerase/thioredoxin
MFPSRLIGFFFILIGCGLASPAIGQKVVLAERYADLNAIIQKASQNKETLLLNFWATWCHPCVEELPLFDKLQREYGMEGLRVVLVSLDFRNYHHKRVLPLIREKGIVAEVVHLVDMNINAWMPLIDEKWDGALPFTIILRGKKRKTQDDKFKDYMELEAFVKPFLVQHIHHAPDSRNTRK